MSELFDQLTAEIGRAEHLLKELPSANGIGYLLLRKAISEARAAIDRGDRERMRFYLDVLRKAGQPTVSRETRKG